ncbi:MAG: 50S ribosomal protein L29 [Syntrophobacterales bacterium]|jgi:large subunit ribosomal protein L29|nr:50S ribosomal protein L29 [Syntrophobacterales bacterium]
MKNKDIINLEKDELEQKRKELKEEYFKLKVRHASGQLETPSSLAVVRKNIARVNTVLRQKEGK